MKAKDILDHAGNLVSGHRQQSYGDPVVCHEKIAIFWNAYLEARRYPSKPLTAIDAAEMLGLMKLARRQVGVPEPDSFIDGAAYPAIAGEIALRED